VDVTAIARACREGLEAARNRDGGWGYARGRGSRLEPTALALVALSAAGARPDGAVLARWAWSHDLVQDPQSGEVNVASNGQAALAAEALGLEPVAARLHDGLVRLKGERLEQAEHTRQDNSLQGWPWASGTFSWVEPTAWCLLAVKRRAATRPTLDAAARIGEAERLLRDRACADGGWNYGNSQVLGRSLAPYVPTTALGLLALGPRPGDATVDRALRLLEARRLSEPSGHALSLARLALSRHGASTAGIDDALDAAWRGDAFLGNLMTMALVLAALSGEEAHALLAA
jgi:hypothetical protein